MLPERKLLHWSVAVSAAFAAHLLLVLGYAGLNPYGAAGEGQGGIEIGLGMLGEMGESLETSDAAEALELPREQPPEPPPPDPPQPQPQPPPPEPEPPQQVTEVAVQTETPEQVPELPEIAPQAEVQATTPSAGGSTAEDAVTQRRQSSGAGNSSRAGGSKGRQASYVSALAAQLNRYKHYPPWLPAAPGRKAPPRYPW